MNFPRYKVNYVSSCVEIQHPHVQTFRNLDSSPGHREGLPGHVLPKFWYCQKEGGFDRIRIVRDKQIRPYDRGIVWSEADNTGCLFEASLRS